MYKRQQTITARQPDELAERLCDTWRATGADAINLRVHLPGLSPHEVRQQITILGEQVLPLLRTRWTPGDTAERVTGPGH